MTVQSLLPQRSQLRALLRKLPPIHVKVSEIKKPEVVSEYYYFYMSGTPKYTAPIFRHEYCMSIVGMF